MNVVKVPPRVRFSCRLTFSVKLAAGERRPIPVTRAIARRSDDNGPFLDVPSEQIEAFHGKRLLWRPVEIAGLYVHDFKMKSTVNGAEVEQMSAHIAGAGVPASMFATLAYLDVSQVPGPVLTLSNANPVEVELTVWLDGSCCLVGDKLPGGVE